MTRPVMVALDGSQKDARALPAALAFAELAGTELQLVRVVEASVDTLTARAGVRSTRRPRGSAPTPRYA
jgi:hypothetical protein